MAQQVFIILHWNTDYAEIPRKELPNVIASSYTPMLEEIRTLEDVVIVHNLTGHTLEYLKNNSPEVIEALKEQVRQKKAELLLTGYSHPILPLLPSQRIRAQLIKHKQLLKELFDASPTGFWPPELAVSPRVLQEASNLNIKWVSIDAEHYALSQQFGNDLNPFERREATTTEVLANAYWASGPKKITTYLKALRHLTRTKAAYPFEPFVNYESELSAPLILVLTSVAWSNATQLALSLSLPRILYSENKHLKSILRAKQRILPLYASDIEFFGYRKLGVNPVSPKKFSQFIKKLQRHEVSIMSPSQEISKGEIVTSAYLTTGSWSPDKSLRIWTESEDNKELSRALNEIYQVLQVRGWPKEILSDIEADLLIAENSDARGWSPLLERKKEAYLAIERIRNALGISA